MSTAVIIGVLAIPTLFSYHAYKLLEHNKEDKWNQALSIFLILMSFIGTWSAVNVAQKIANNAVAADVFAATNISWMVVVVGGTVMLAYFVLRVLFNTLELAFRGGKL